MSWVKSLKPI